jgi:hypothetical protein
VFLDFLSRAPDVRVGLLAGLSSRVSLIVRDELLRRVLLWHVGSTEAVQMFNGDECCILLESFLISDTSFVDDVVAYPIVATATGIASRLAEVATVAIDMYAKLGFQITSPRENNCHHPHIERRRS